MNSKQSYYNMYSNSMNTKDYEYYSNEELVSLIQSGQQVKENMQRLFLKNFSIIYAISKQYGGTSIEDAIQASYLGLYEAATRFDKYKECKFTSIMFYWIRSYILKFRETDQQYHIPRHIIVDINRYKRLVNSYLMEYGFKPSHQQLCDLLNVNEKKLLDIEKAISSQNVTSLDCEMDTNEESSTLEEVTADSNNNIDEFIESTSEEQYKKAIWNIVDSNTTEMENKVIKDYYLDKYTLESLGNLYGQNTSSVRAIRDKALRKLRTGKASKSFKELQMESSAYRGNGLQAYRNRLFTSKVEAIALEHSKE